jgi:hypothetical protein
MQSHVRTAPIRFTRAWRVLALLLLAAGSAHGAPAGGTGTAAGTVVEATAVVRFRLEGGAERTVASAPAAFVVDERIQVDVTFQQDRPRVEPGRPDAWLGALVTNLGNGGEAFRLAADVRLDEPAGVAPGFDPLAPRLYADDGSGVCDEADARADGLLGAEPLTLGAGEAALVCVAAEIPADAADRGEGGLRLQAAPDRDGVDALPVGAVLAGAGDGGSDAVLASPGGADADAGAYVASRVAVVVDKAVVRIDDGRRAGAPGTADAGALVPGAVVTYRLALTVTGTGRSGVLELVDDLPPPDVDGGGIAYRPGSLRIGAGPADVVPATDLDDGVELELAGVPAAAAALSGAPGDPFATRLRVTFDDAAGDLDPAAPGFQPWTAVVLFDVEIR